MQTNNQNRRFSCFKQVRHSSLTLVTAAILILTLLDRNTARSANAATISSVRTTLQSAFDQLPAPFIANIGQIDSPMRFEVRGMGETLWFQAGGVMLNLSAPHPNASTEQPLDLKGTRNSITIHRTFDYADPNTIVEGIKPLPGIANFFIGSDPKQWRTNVPTYGAVVYSNLYSGVNLEYENQSRLLKGRYTIAAGVDPALIRWRYAGANSMTIDPTTGNLNIGVAYGLTLTEKAPRAWQIFNGVTTSVAVNYQLGIDGAVQFRPDIYDQTQPLMIDSSLDYPAYQGANGVYASSGIAVDSGGNAYITGITSNMDFPTTAGAFQTAYSGYGDTFVSKLNATGTALVYSTYLGGSGADFGNGIAVDADGDAYVAGYTTSLNFPTTSGAFQTTYSGGYDDAFVTKLNASGNALVYSTYLGGNKGDRATGIAIDSNGNAYITGDTYSSNFPTTSGAFQTTYSGGSNDAFVSKLNATGSGLIYSTYLGGNGSDGGCSIAVDSSGNAYVTGGTTSTNFPTSPGAVQTTYGSNTDTFVSKLNASGSALVYSTYLGSSGSDTGNGIAVDSNGNAYVTGFTFGANFPTTNEAFQTHFYGNEDAFVSKLNASGSALVYSTLLGGSGIEIGTGVAVDGSGDAYVTGLTVSTDFPTTNEAAQTALGGKEGNAFVSKLTAGGTGLVYSTYLGGSGFDFADGIAVDVSGNAYITGWTFSPNFPITTGALPTTPSNSNNAPFVTKLTVGGTGLVYSTYLVANEK